jgi:hypothetical protein
MIDHLRQVYRTEKHGHMDKKDAVTQRIDRVFRKVQQRVAINLDLFKQLLLRWIIVNQIAFRQVECNAIRQLLYYLLECVCSLPSLLKLVADCQQGCGLLITSGGTASIRKHHSILDYESL